MQLVATPLQRLLLLILSPPFVQGHIFPFQFLSQLLNLVMFIQIFTQVKFAENKTQLTVRGRLFFLLSLVGLQYLGSRSQRVCRVIDVNIDVYRVIVVY